MVCLPNISEGRLSLSGTSDGTDSGSSVGHLQPVRRPDSPLVLIQTVGPISVWRYNLSSPLPLTVVSESILTNFSLFILPPHHPPSCALFSPSDGNPSPNPPSGHPTYLVTERGLKGTRYGSSVELMSLPWSPLSLLHLYKYLCLVSFKSLGVNPLTDE